MNYATKLCIVSMVSVCSVSSMGLVQAADTPIVSTGGVAYNIGLQVINLLFLIPSPSVTLRVPMLRVIKMCGLVDHKLLVAQLIIQC